MFLIKTILPVECWREQFHDISSRHSVWLGPVLAGVGLCGGRIWTEKARDISPAPGAAQHHIIADIIKDTQGSRTNISSILPFLNITILIDEKFHVQCKLTLVSFNPYFGVTSEVQSAWCSSPEVASLCCAAIRPLSVLSLQNTFL